MFGWRRKKQSDESKTDAVPAPEMPATSGEFASADQLDNDVAPNPSLPGIERALELLRGQHLAFRKPEPHEVSDLEKLRLRILTAVTEAPGLEDYYHEAWGSKKRAAVSDAAAGPAPHRPYRSIAVMQIELITRAFYALQLQLFANAPENRGWMTLFRSWGRSPRFNAIVDELAPTLSPDVEKFYRVYLRDLPARASAYGNLPIHHPWLPPPTRRGRGVYMDSGLVEAEIEIDVRPGAGGVVDAHGSEKADRTFETPSAAGTPGDTTDPAPNE
jgi:hypothetical protein